MRFFLTPHSAVKLKWQKFFPISRNLRKKRQTSDQFFFLIKHNKSFRTKYLSKSLFMFLLSFGLVKSNTKFWLGSTFAIISSFFLQYSADISPTSRIIIVPFCFSAENKMCTKKHFKKKEWNQHTILSQMYWQIYQTIIYIIWQF